MPVQTIISQAGPLGSGISAQFSVPTDDPICILVSGSVWATQANQMIGFYIQLDGQQIGAAQIYSNGPNTHRAVVPVFIPAQLAFGNHTMSLTAYSGTTSDGNDFFCVSALW